MIALCSSCSAQFSPESTNGTLCGECRLIRQSRPNARVGAGSNPARAGLRWLRRLVVAMVAVRFVTLAVTVLRLIVAFATLGEDLGWIEAALYAVAPTLGTAVGIVPAGLGINEAIAAGLATLVAGSSATAFLAVALNRALGLAVGAGLVLGGSTRRGRE